MDHNSLLNGDMNGKGANQRVVVEVPNLILLADNEDVSMQNYATHSSHDLNSGVGNPLSQAAHFGYSLSFSKCCRQWNKLEIKK